MSLREKNLAGWVGLIAFFISLFGPDWLAWCGMVAAGIAALPFYLDI